MTLTSVIVLSVAAAACVTDLRSRRIPNVLTFGAAIAALVFAGVTGGWSALFLACGGWIVGAAIFFLPFALGGLGGGDVKLLAALGAWLGPHDALWLGLYTGTVGGIAALVVALANGYLKQALTNIWSLFIHWHIAGIGPLDAVSLEGSAGPRLAYALPICGGLMVTLWLR
jgi:prepilin peptidase CpaA